jgi:hypothetical protein
MQIPNWKCSTTQRFAAEKGSSACLRSQRTKGWSFWVDINERAWSTKLGEGEELGEGVLMDEPSISSELRWDEDDEDV